MCGGERAGGESSTRVIKKILQDLSLILFICADLSHALHQITVELELRVSLNATLPDRY